jgi:hypothetical protein
MSITTKASALPDIYPQDASCTLRWPNGEIWVPVLTGTGILGRVTRKDRADYVASMESQMRALERAVNTHREQTGQAPWPPRMW